MLKTNDVVSSYNSLYIANAINKEDNSFNEDVFLLYDPDGYGGVLTIGEEIVDIIDQ